MSIEQQLVNVDQVNKLFSKGEGHFCELKSKDIQPKRLTKTMSAFANADGGELYVGNRRGYQGCVQMEWV